MRRGSAVKEARERKRSRKGRGGYAKDAEGSHGVHSDLCVRAFAWVARRPALVQWRMMAEAIGANGAGAMTRLRQIPFYDPELSYEGNYARGPFGVFAQPGRRAANEHAAAANVGAFLGEPVRVPFGIPAGPLLNGRFVKAALDFGFDLPVYKTVRTRAWASHGWPNVLAVHAAGDLHPTVNRLQAHRDYSAEALSITNSFGVPSMSPEVWQPDLADAVAHAGPGQVVVGSFQGTQPERGGVGAYIADFALAARLMRETGVRLTEVNLSCPNEGTAHLLCFDAERTTAVVDAIKAELGGVKLLAKIAYFAEDEPLRRLLAGIGPLVDGVVAINTIPAEVVDAAGAQALPGEGRLRSGVCGSGIRWAGLSMTQRLVRLRAEMGFRFTVVGVGGVNTAADYHAYRRAGADAVMSATGAMWNPLLAEQIHAEMRETIHA